MIMTNYDDVSNLQSDVVSFTASCLLLRMNSIMFTIGCSHKEIDQYVSSYTLKHTVNSLKLGGGGAGGTPV